MLGHALVAASIGLLPVNGGDVRINELQVIGTHNSYHIAPHPNVLKLIGATSRRQAEALDYTHRPFAEQFSDLGIRQIELDVFADPQGRHYTEPAARKILQAQGKDAGPDPASGGRLDRPGLKVFHVQDIDYQSRAATFVDALTQVREWSKAHPRHVPILILVELKDDAIPLLSTRPVRFERAELDSVDAEILSVFDRRQLITPDDLRGDSESLPDAIRARGWPLLEPSRGKILFALDNEGAIRDRYLQGHAALRGRLMFVNVDPSHPAAAFLKVNDAVKDFDRIRQLVREGFLVRTRADTDTNEARQDDTSRREKALNSGAQFVSTDYPEPRAEFSPYHVQLPGRIVARTNPVNGAGGKAAGDLEAARPLAR